MIDEAPAIPLLVRSDGRIEGSARLAHWLGLPEMPEYLSELHRDEETGLSEDQLAELTGHVRRAQKTAAPFRMELSVPGSQRSLALRGSLADAQISPGGAAIVWVFDFSESETELARMREETSRAKGDFAALVNLIEAAPMPMWFRGKDTKLRLVNASYVEAVDGGSADEVIASQIELVEAVDGLTAAQIAGQAAQQSQPIERIVQATIDGERRALRISDLPVQGEGIAGYAVDIEDMEQQARGHRAYSEAQRSMLDRLSVGVAQFDGARKLAFANQPFRRIFAIRPGSGAQGMAFERWLSEARDEGRTPEVRDFPAWRAEHGNWFSGGETQEENWPLADGTHLSIIAQPMPDGGLMLIAEDKTEQLALSATRDTMLRHTYRHLRQPVRSAGGVLARWEAAGLEPHFRFDLGRGGRAAGHASGRGCADRGYRPEPVASATRQNYRRDDPLGDAGPEREGRACRDGRWPYAGICRRTAP